MALAISARIARASFLSFLAAELEPWDGRAQMVARITVACVLTVVVTMIFRIPEPPYIAYIVFLISKDEKSATLTSAVGSFAAITVAIILTVLLAIVDTAEPALRLPAMALVTFVAMWGVRTLSLGPIAFLAGFVIVELQSLTDDIPNTEALTRAILWLWVVALIPVVTTILLGSLFGRSGTAVLERGFRSLLLDIKLSLAQRDANAHAIQWRERAVGLLTKVSGLQGHGPATFRISTESIERLLEATVLIESMSADIPSASLEPISVLLDECLLAITAIPTIGAGSNSPPPAIAPTPNSQFPVVIALKDTLSAVLASLRSPASSRPAVKRPLLVPDALSNPEYWQYALKATIAVLIVYFIYTMLDWPGIRTSITTCFFVALGSLGETVHKLLLRISGALIGGLLAGLCIVFLLPHFTDIGQLSLLIGAVSFIAAWVATSSERLAYAGLQIAFAFYLGILQGYAPATDLTVLRDRVAGILLGNVVITLVFGILWPTSAATKVRHALTELMRNVAALLKDPLSAAPSRVMIAQALGTAEHFEQLSIFELSMAPRSNQEFVSADDVATLSQLSSAALVTTSASLLPFSDRKVLRTVSRWAEAEVTGGTVELPGDVPMPSISEESRLRAAARTAQNLLVSIARHVQARTI
jgi:multidrug resistance protein MdtO